MIRNQSGSKSLPFDNMFGNAPPITLRNPRDHGLEKLWSSKDIPSMQKQGEQSIDVPIPAQGNREWRTAPDIVKVPVIQAIHEGDGGMLAETSE
jgi:hypothetical protein